MLLAAELPVMFRTREEFVPLRLARTSPAGACKPVIQLSHPGPAEDAVGQHSQGNYTCDHKDDREPIGSTKALPAINEGRVRHAPAPLFVISTTGTGPRERLGLRARPGHAEGFEVVQRATGDALLP